MRTQIWGTSERQSSIYLLRVSVSFKISDINGDGKLLKKKLTLKDYQKNIERVLQKHPLFWIGCAEIEREAVLYPKV